MPVYNAELAPKTLRGRLVSLNQLAITAGIMVSETSKPTNKQMVTHTYMCILGELPYQPCLQHLLRWLESVSGNTGSLWLHSHLWHDLSSRNTKASFTTSWYFSFFFLPKEHTALALLHAMDVFVTCVCRWLVKKHKDVKASKVLSKLRRSSAEDVKEELTEIQESLKGSDVEGKPWWWAWMALLNWRMIQR